MSFTALQAQWPAPEQVRTCITTRRGGCSQGPWKGFNLGDHVGDDPAHVAANRAELQRSLGCAPAWLKQVHGTLVVEADAGRVMEADASWTGQPGVACSIMTADCLPVLLCNQAGTRVAAAHAGWRGLLAGVLENTVGAMGEAPDNLMAWLGPAIGPRAFEVGPEVFEAFRTADASAIQAFEPSERSEHYLADIYTLARQRLEACGVERIYGAEHCTVNDPTQFFSYRRDGQTGRFVSMIWLENAS
ncbi:peptidoglycan editing factor PgeF [Halopseudomonas salina]|uniref:Purine nucleoside phosphorylase n=1 Tax=Halopseudomonas salina TaxID=1323744 RepID=A0ABQ1PQD7_9GAMM|nr:peptidoglycan editing factor PgeF [Halopseudomonas salina]GGD00939.1 laccase domain protein [Halopseudomonas salina]